MLGGFFLCGFVGGGWMGVAFLGMEWDGCILHVGSVFSPYFEQSLELGTKAVFVVAFRSRRDF